MTPTQNHDCNVIFRSEDPTIAPLPAAHDGKTFISYWEPDITERAKIAAGGKIRLTVHRTQPPVTLDVEPPKSPPPACTPAEIWKHEAETFSNAHPIARPFLELAFLKGLSKGIDLLPNDQVLGMKIEVTKRIAKIAANPRNS